MAASFCKRCGAEVRKFPLGITGNLFEGEPRFCRQCGCSLFPRQHEEDDDLFTNDLAVIPDWDDLSNFRTLEEVIGAAVPDNYKELTIEQLRRHIVGSLWKRYTGRDPYPSEEQLAAMEEYHRQQMQRCIESGVPPILPPMLAPRSWFDESLKDSVRQYHQFWLDGLVLHLNLTPEEAKEMSAWLERYYYKLVPCDCDKVKYIPDETYPHLLRKA